MSFCSMPKPGNIEQLRREDFNYFNQFALKEKVLAMANILQLTNEEIYERERIVEKIINLLRPYYPDCNVLIFGSSLNGFGLRGCDLDLLFLPFPEYCDFNFKGKYDGTIPSPYRVLQRSFPRAKLLSMEDVHHLKFVKRIMYSQNRFFERIIFIPAKCPILSIKFVGNPISCDFSASNRLVVNNTELLQVFGFLDVRVRPLIIVLRYWAKSLGFIAKSLLSSYAFTLMVIFYLQNVQPPILPSVKYLIEKAGYSRIIDGWETAICLDHNQAFTSENSTDIDQLLVDFFEFYWNFDFLENVVSPYHGRPLHVKELKESDDDRIRDFKVTAFSIQDAFVLSRNVSRNADMKTSFKLASLIAKKLVLDKNFTYQSLFNYSVYQQEMDTLFKHTENNSSNLVSFSIPLNYNFYSRFGVTDNFDHWYKKVCQAVLDVLQYGLLIDCEVIDSVIWKEDIIENPPKKIKIEPADVKSFQLLMSIQCASHFNTMFGRKSGMEATADSEDEDADLPDLLRKQFKISKQLLKESTDTSVFWFMCQCYKYSATQIPDVIITFSPLSYIPDFAVKKHFLKSYVKKIVEGLIGQI